MLDNKIKQAEPVLIIGMGIVRKSLCGLGFGLLLLAVQLNLEPAQATVMVAGSVPDSTHSTLELWLDASTLAASTTSVSVWADQTSHGRNTVQTVAANQPRYTAINPIFKNRPTLHFDGNDILTSENVSVMNIDAAKPRSIFVVFSQDAVANQNVLGFGVISSAQMFDVLLYENKFLGHFSGEGVPYFV